MQEEIKNNKKYKVAIVAPTPVYYHAPLYRLLYISLQIDLMVYYCSNETLSGIEIKKMYGADARFESQEELLSGYQFKFLKNRSFDPSYMKWPLGLINIDIYKEIKDGRYDAVILQSWTNLTWWIAFFACLIHKVPVLFMTDENILSKKAKPTWKKALKRMVVGNFLFKFTAGFLTAGLANEALYKHFGVPEKKLMRMYFSWGYERFLYRAQEIKSQREQIRRELGIEEHDFVMLFVGRLSHEKNPFMLLDADNLVNHPHKKLFFAGDGPLKPMLKQYIKDLNIKCVYFAGFQNRTTLPNFYTMADVFILPSIYEPWGIVINEAMCFSLPIVASDRVGAAVDLVHSGSNGYVFSAQDTKQLVVSIENLAAQSPEERKAFGDESFKIISEWIAKIKPAEQIIKIIQKANNGYE